MRSGGGDRRRGRRRPDRHQHGLPGAEGAARPAPAPRCCATPTWRSPLARARRRGQRACRSRSSCAPASSPATAPASSSPSASPRRRASPAIAFHPRPATDGHKGAPDYALTRELVERRRRAGDRLRRAAKTPRPRAAPTGVRRRRGDDRPRLARQPVGLRGADRRARPSRPAAEEVVAELLWTIDRAEEHWGAERAARYLRKFYPWYLERLGLRGPRGRRVPARADARARARDARGEREAAAARRLNALQRPGPQPPRYNRAPARARVRTKRRAFGRFVGLSRGRGPQYERGRGFASGS